MTWQSHILLLLDPADDVVREAAHQWKKRYRIPAHMCFAIEAIKGYERLAKGSLQGSTADTKIIVVSHGEPQRIQIGDRPCPPEGFAHYLRGCGLSRAGLLAFKGCELGKRHFLERLAAELLALGTLVEWMVAYRHVTVQLSFLSHQWSGLLDYPIRTWTRGRAKMPDSYRIKVIRGYESSASRRGSCRYE